MGSEKKSVSDDGLGQTSILKEPIVYRTAELHYASYCSFRDTAVQTWKQFEP